MPPKQCQGAHSGRQSSGPAPLPPPSRRKARPNGRSPGSANNNQASSSSTYDDAEKALDAAVAIEERAERFARAQGDKARRLLEEALALYRVAVQLGGETYADACYNAGRTMLVLATDFYTPAQARLALPIAVAHFLAALSARLNDANTVQTVGTTALHAQLGVEVKVTVALIQGADLASLEAAVSKPPASPLPSGSSSDDDAGSHFDPFLVDIISSAASALQALAELDEHYGHQQPSPQSVRGVFATITEPQLSILIHPLTTMVGAVRMSALACACYAQAIDASSLRSDEQQSLLDEGEAEFASEVPPQSINSDLVDGDDTMDAEPTLSSTYEGSTNPITPSGYASALSDCIDAISSLLSLIDGAELAANAGTHKALISWCAGAGRSLLLEADRLQRDVQQAGPEMDETEQDESIATLSKLRHAPFLLDVATLTAAESPTSAQDGDFCAEMTRLEAQLVATAEQLLQQAQGPTPPEIEELCGVADGALCLSQQRLRVAAQAGFHSSSGANASQSAWTSASTSAKLLLKAYALLEASGSSNSSSSGATLLVLGGGAHDGRGGLLSERQRTQLGISVALAQVSLLRLHPLLAPIRASQPAPQPQPASTPSAGSPTRTLDDVLRANASAYARRALLQAGLRWIVQYADDAARPSASASASPSASARKLGPAWAQERALEGEHMERVLHQGWEVLSLRAEAVVVALRAAWFRFVSGLETEEGMGGGGAGGGMTMGGALLERSSAGREVLAMLECLVALLTPPSAPSHTQTQQLQHATEKALETAEIANAWAAEVLASPPSSSASQDAPWRRVRAIADADEQDGSVSLGAASSAHHPSLSEASFWSWVVREVVKPFGDGAR